MPLSNYVKSIRAHIGSDLLVLVGAAAIIIDEADKVLLQLRSDNHTWGPPGGGVEPGEEPAVAVIREVEEETGLIVVPERLVGIYGGSDMLFSYPNGDRTAITSVTFACRVVGGALRLDDDESLDLRWFAFDELPESIAPWIRQRIVHAFTLREPYFYRPSRNLIVDSPYSAELQRTSLTKVSASSYVQSMRARIGTETLVLVGTAAVICNEQGEILMQLRRDTGTWGLPGGFLEPGEEASIAVVREALEETGMIVEPTRLVGVYGGPRMVYAYPNGDMVADTAIVFACQVVTGAKRVADDESLDLRWFLPDSLPVREGSRIHRWITDALTRETPYFHSPGAEEQE